MTNLVQHFITPEIIPAPPTLAFLPMTPAREKLESLITAGKERAREVVESIYREQPVDYLIKSTALTFALNDSQRSALLIPSPDGLSLHPLHHHAFGQVADKLGIPRTYAERLAGGEAPHKKLLVHNLNQLAWSAENGRYLVRTVDGEIRGFLSDRYRRMDGRPIVETFAAAVEAAGAVPYDGVNTDVSFSIRAILPIVHEPVPGEAMAFGLELCSSEFGARALSVSLFCLRIRCANLAVFEESMRKVHLGARLQDDTAFSEKTYTLDTATIASAVGDIVTRNFLPERIETITALIRKSAEEHVSPSQLSAWLKRNVSKAEAEAITNTFNSPDIEMLPPGQSRWRFSNALSFFAATLEDKERQLDMQRLAGRALTEAA